MKQKIKIAKFGQFLTSRPDGREAALTSIAYDVKIRAGSEVKLDFSKVLVLTPSWLSEFVQTLKSSGIKNVEYSSSKNASVHSSIEAVIADSAEEKIHPWRLCPLGHHWVTKHPMRVRPSAAHPEGIETQRKGHCARNPSGMDILFPEEMSEIAARYFKLAKKKPCPQDLGYPAGNQYDDFVAGWTQYWNEVLKPTPPLDPNIVKALIASESSFDPKMLANRKNSNSARGLTQLKNDTRRILQDEKGELKDHFIKLTKAELNDPNLNICAGIRWLFHKRTLASGKIKKEASWIQAIANYKGILNGFNSGTDEARKKMKPFSDHLKRLEKCNK